MECPVKTMSYPLFLSAFIWCKHTSLNTSVKTKVHQWKATDIITQNAAHVLFKLFPASCICLEFVQGEVLVLIMLKSKHASYTVPTLYEHTDPTTSLFTAPTAKYENCNLGACLAYCTIRGPNSDFWTFMHTVPASLERQHDGFCSVDVMLV